MYLWKMCKIQIYRSFVITLWWYFEVFSIVHSFFFNQKFLTKLWNMTKLWNTVVYRKLKKLESIFNENFVSKILLLVSKIQSLYYHSGRILLYNFTKPDHQTKEQYNSFYIIQTVSEKFFKKFQYFFYKLDQIFFWFFLIFF